MQTIFTDGIANLSLVDGVVRMDLVNVSNIEHDKTNIRTVGALAMSLPGLIRTQEQLSKAIDKMVADGILKKNEPDNSVN